MHTLPHAEPIAVESTAVCVRTCFERPLTVEIGWVSHAFKFSADRASATIAKSRARADTESSR